MIWWLFANSHDSQWNRPFGLFESRIPAWSAAFDVLSTPACINRRCRTLKSIEKNANLVSSVSFSFETASIFICTALTLLHGTFEARITLGSTCVNEDVYGS